ncbi:amidase [Faunimonas pinastri]|uniref:Indoleacetamide hydrolase n=1 Tax=Faunimonas pinastri TaxID=1855383 RepID=A0A1H9E503_9HYPH|nr:amidase [Faunimonas pinastri]SEQ20804.1 amidase [Faunimonas pinastri]
MESPELHYRQLTDVAIDIKAHRLSPVEVTQAILARIEKLEPELQSYTTVTADLALEQAREAEAEIMQGRYRSPLHGIPIAVKDLCYTKGIPTSAGMAINRNWVPDYDATVVKRLRDSGAIILGKLHMTEGATLEHHPEMPPPRNPWNSDLWTGVSSSGSGVATAAGLCYASLGSDTGGSIRFPSACNALTGVKPTWGRVSRYGVFDLGASYDTVGPMTRSAADSATVLRAIAGYDENDPTSLSDPVPDYLGDLQGVYGARALTIGVDWGFNSEDADPAMIAQIEAAAAIFAELGAELRDVEFPDPGLVLDPSMNLIGVELAVAHEGSYPGQAERYGPAIAKMIESGRNADPVQLGRAMIERDKFRGRMARLFTKVDAVIIPVFMRGSPTWSEVADLVENDMRALMKFTSPINASRNPTVTLPCGFTPDGNPVAFQLVGAHCSEGVLLRAAHAYQQMTDWHTRRPPLA